MKKGKNTPDSGILGGLKAAFVFLVVFILLRYSIPLSVLFAAIGGLTIGIVLSWWESQEAAQPQRHFKLKKVSLKKHYPNIDQISSHASRRGSLNKKSPEKNPED